MTPGDEWVLLRRQYIEKQFSHLNAMQREAVFHTEGPMLILAGAGSGKTTVLVNRISNIVAFGDAYASDYVNRAVKPEDLEHLRAAIEGGTAPHPDIAPLLHTGHTKPWNVLAITFTNKAAAELKSRICAAAGPEGNDVFASTFHAACVRFLRRDAMRLGFAQNFAIYDSDDQQRVIKDIYKHFAVDDKVFPVRWMGSRISHLKDELVSPQDFAERAADLRDRMVSKVYTEYQQRLRKAGAFDFDDLIYFTVRLLEECPEVREYYHHRFHYIMVDEYQDTSFAQYRLVELLTDPVRRNICVVGDDDQSIYRFRGATIENILNFEEHFRGAHVIRLEQNYRSTASILDAANEVIAHNIGRKGKTLWTDKGAGELIRVFCADSELEEASYVSSEILRNKNAGIALNRQAVLYRMNAQSSSIENYFARAGIPYRIYGGLRFFDRAEVKDIVSYLSVIENPADNLRLTRIINRPTRKIGDTTVNTILQIASELGISMMEVVRSAGDYPALSRSKNALDDFCAMLGRLQRAYESEGLADFCADLLDITGYRQMLIAAGDEGRTRLENVEELVSSLRTFELKNPDGDLALFLEEIALIASIDSYDENTDAVVMMTLHSAKGLEFDCVYIIGMEEGLFPSEQSRYKEEDIEEERRLAYVGYTRARRQLHLVRAYSRMLFGQTRRNLPSRFLEEFSDELKDEELSKKLGRDRRPSYEMYNQSVSRERSETIGAKPRPQLGSTISVGETPKKPQGPSSERYAAGDRVVHRIFGAGTVLSAKPLGGDVLVEVDFDTVGIKKAMANYAPMKKE